MGGRKITLIVSAIFYSVMLLFTVSARQIHKEALPKVTVMNLLMESFPVANDGDIKVEADNIEKSSDQIKDTVSYRWSIAIPKELYEQQKVYILSSQILNGEERTIAREVTNLMIGASSDASYEVIQGITGLDQVIVTGLESIYDGCEVFVENE